MNCRVLVVLKVVIAHAQGSGEVKIVELVRDVRYSGGEDGGSRHRKLVRARKPNQYQWCEQRGYVGEQQFGDGRVKSITGGGLLYLVVQLVLLHQVRVLVQ